MYKKSLLIVLSIFVFLSSCSKDDEDKISNSTDLIGKWEIHTIIEYQNDVAIEEDHYQAGQRVWEFKSNGYVHIKEEGGMNRDVEYNFKPENNEVIVMGILLKIEKLTRNELQLRDGVHEMQYRKI